MTILFAHGFGVRSDARGLFTDIANTFNRHTFVFTELTDILEDSGYLYTPPLDLQAQRLDQAVKTSAQPIDTVIAHSMGCLVVTLMAQKPKNILLLAPPFHFNTDKTMSNFKGRLGCVLNRQGESLLPRRDGSVTLVPSSYWDSHERLDPTQQYASLTQQNVHAFIADQDEVLGQEHIDPRIFPHITFHHLNANHDFTGQGRADLIACLGQVLEI